MKDVTPTQIKLKCDFVRVKYIGPAIRILKNPVQEISTLPFWSFQECLIVILAISAVQGFLSAFFEPKLIPGIISGVLIFPIASCLGAVSALFFIYYALQFFENKQVELNQLFTIVTLSLIPFWILTIPVAAVSPLFLVGFAVTCAILAVGISEHFGVLREKSVKLLSILWLFGFLFWIWNNFDYSKVQNRIKDSQIPKVELGQ